MRTRRFGRTELRMPLFTLGGMRFSGLWEKDLTRKTVKEADLAAMREIVDRALETGINHIETAHGYGNSEQMLGWVLADIPRDRYLLQTKVTPREDPEAFEETLRTSFDRLGLETLDLLSLHGINNREVLEWTVRKGGCLDVLRRWQRDGRIRFVGFSTHGPWPVIVEAVETGEFDYLNVHWYFINQTNYPAVEAAARHDMGVFIISPTDKGGMLQKPSGKLVEHCRPLHPITFNDLFCLRCPHVHTLSLGAARPSDFEEHLAVLEHIDDIDAAIRPIEKRIDKTMTTVHGADWWPRYNDGVPFWYDIPGEVNVQYILRLWTWATAFGMTEYGKYRYGMIEGGKGGHWMSGKPARDLDEAGIRAALGGHPCPDKVITALREADERFSGNERKPMTAE